MPRMKVQCRGSGQQIGLGTFAKRMTCPVCHTRQDLTGLGRIRRHDRILSKRQVKRMA